MTSYFVLNIVVSILVIVGVVGLLGWAIATQHRDHISREIGIAKRRHRRPSRAPVVAPARPRVSFGTSPLGEGMSPNITRVPEYVGASTELD